MDDAENWFIYTKLYEKQANTGNQGVWFGLYQKQEGGILFNSNCLHHCYIIQVAYNQGCGCNRIAINIQFSVTSMPVVCKCLLQTSMQTLKMHHFIGLMVQVVSTVTGHPVNPTDAALNHVQRYTQNQEHGTIILVIVIRAMSARPERHVSQIF